MARHHVREKEPGWRLGLVINATGAVMTAVVDIVIVMTKFTHGAWVIVVLVPVMIVFLVRAPGQYKVELSGRERTAARTGRRRGFSTTASEPRNRERRVDR